MKVNKTELLKALDIVKAGLASKEMIEQSGSFCFLNGSVTTFNDEISITTPLKGFKIEGAINAIELYSYISKVKTEELSAEITGNEIIFKAGRSQAGLLLVPKVVLPLDEINNDENWKTLPKNFLKGLSFAMGVCSRDTTSPILTCVHVNKGIIEAADNFRLITFTLSKKMKVDEFLLPADSCSKVVSFNPIEISEGAGWIHFKNEDNAILSCRVFMEKYVNLAPHMKVEGAVLNFPKAIQNILERASIFSLGSTKLDSFVTITMENNKMIIKSRSESGWFSERAKAVYEGEKVSFNVTTYLLQDILKETTEGIISDTKILFTGDNWNYLTLLRGVK